MTRIACLYVPMFPLAARLRSEPELLSEALAIVEGNGSTAHLVAATRREQARRARRRRAAEVADDRRRGTRSRIPRAASAGAPHAAARRRIDAATLGHLVHRRARATPRVRNRRAPRRARTRAALRRARRRSASAHPARAPARISRRDGARVAARRTRAVPLHRQQRTRSIVEADGVSGIRVQATRAHDDARARRLSRARDRSPRADARHEDHAHAAPPRPREVSARRGGRRLLARRTSRTP